MRGQNGKYYMEQYQECSIFFTIYRPVQTYFWYRVLNFLNCPRSKQRRPSRPSTTSSAIRISEYSLFDIKVTNTKLWVIVLSRLTYEIHHSGVEADADILYNA